MQEPNAMAGQSHDANNGKKRKDRDNDGDEGEKINKKVTVCVADAKTQLTKVYHADDTIATTTNRIDEECFGVLGCCGPWCGTIQPDHAP